MTEPNAHEQLPPEERHILTPDDIAVGRFPCGHAWASHTAKGCLAWVEDPTDEHAVCPCTVTIYDHMRGDTELIPRQESM